MHDIYYRLMMLIASIVGMLLMVIAGLVVAAFHGPLYGAAVAIAGGGGVCFAAYCFRPRTDLSSRIYLTALTVLSGAFALTTVENGLRLWLINVLGIVLKPLGLQLPNVEAAASPLVFYALCVSVVLICGFVWTRKSDSITELPQSSTPAINSKTLRDPEFIASLKRYCGSLAAFLTRYDIEVNWSDREYLPLEATVELAETTTRRPKLALNMVEAIRRDRKSMTFVVIGDPGCGKSVSLRNLVRRLADEATSTGVIPLYVNLREFPAGNPVTVETLVDFVLETALRQTGRDGHRLFTGLYEDFRKSGQLFLVFDSFDEMPHVLDADDGTDSHRQICEAFDQLFTQEIRSCRAVIASRRFRAPTGVQGTRLIIHPFNRAQIRAFLNLRSNGLGFTADDLIKTIYRERPAMVAMLHNPFTAEMLAEYAGNHGGLIPSDRYSVFSSFIETRIHSDEPVLRDRFNISSEFIPECMRQLATTLYAGDMGLECPLSIAEACLDTLRSNEGRNLLNAMQYTRLIRFGDQKTTLCTFVHRRIGEFFVVDGLRRRTVKPDISAIPTDSRWWEVLVMYYEVADASERSDVVDAATQHILRLSDQLEAADFPDAVAAVHWLRFMSDANLRGTLAKSDAYDAIASLIIRLLQSKDVLIAKLAAEHIALLNDQQQIIALKSAFRSSSRWVQQQAVHSCALLGDVDKDTAVWIVEHFEVIPVFEQISYFRDIDFTISLAEALHPARRMVRISFVRSVFMSLASLAVISMCVVLHPLAACGILFIVFILTAVDTERARHQRYSCVLQWVVLVFGILMLASGSTDYATWGASAVALVTLMLFGRGIGGLLRIKRFVVISALSEVGAFSAKKSSVAIVSLVLAPPVNKLLREMFPVLDGVLYVVSAVCAVVAAVFGFAIIVMLAFAIWRHVCDLKRLWHDRWRLSRGGPREVTPDLLRTMLHLLQSSYGRQSYLRMLRDARATRSSMHEDEWHSLEAEMPQLLKGDAFSIEEWGRLRELWVGLAR